MSKIIASMTFAEAKATADALDLESSRTGKVLRAFPQGPMGLTPDAVRATTEWKAAKYAADKAFAELRAFNAVFVKAFKSELAAERKARNLRRTVSA